MHFQRVSWGFLAKLRSWCETRKRLLGSDNNEYTGNHQTKWGLRANRERKRHNHWQACQVDITKTRDGSQTRMSMTIMLACRLVSSQLQKIKILSFFSDKERRPAIWIRRKKPRAARRDSNKGFANASRTFQPLSYEATAGNACTFLSWIHSFWKCAPGWDRRLGRRSRSAAGSSSRGRASGRGDAQSRERVDLPEATDFPPYYFIQGISEFLSQQTVSRCTRPLGS